ncbi:MAG: 3-deoxy-D-manno-octulosonic acid transferase [Pirellulaceae bacterium]
MSLLLDVAYLLLIVALSPWLAFAAFRKGKYREGYSAKFLGRVPPRTSDAPCIWFHAVSVGEVNLLQTLLDRIGEEYAPFECVVSTTTKTGYDLARRKYSNHRVFYCPLDFSWAVRTAMRRIRPQVLVLAELELWPNLIRAAHRRGTKVAIVNGRLSETSWRGYRRGRFLVEPLLRQLDLIAVQNEEYAERFRDLGATASSVHVTGSLKFDGAQTERDNPLSQKLAALAGIDNTDIVFLAGSTQEPEEVLALATFCDLGAAHPKLRLILVPRHPQRCDEVAALLDAASVRWQRRSQLDRQDADPNARILLVDTVGELGGWWGTAQIAFVGGSMGRRGGQNMIEPAAYGAAVSFGPNTQNFREVVSLLLREEAAVVTRDGAELIAFVRRCLDQPHWADQQGQRARQLVLAQRGAIDRTVKLLATLLTHFGERQQHPNAA